MNKASGMGFIKKSIILCTYLILNFNFIHNVLFPYVENKKSFLLYYYTTSMYSTKTSKV